MNKIISKTNLNKLKAAFALAKDLMFSFFISQSKVLAKQPGICPSIETCVALKRSLMIFGSGAGLDEQACCLHNLLSVFRL